MPAKAGIHGFPVKPGMTQKGAGMTTLFVIPAYVIPAYVIPAYVTPAYVTPAKAGADAGQHLKRQHI
jgi:hypothetical protein